MASEVTIYHNPRCSKSRQTLDLLRQRGIEPHIVRYLEDPPTAEELRAILNQLGIEPRAMMRTKETEYRDLGLADATDEALIAAMVAHPILIERPIVQANGKAALGRPPERVLEIL